MAQPPPQPPPETPRGPYERDDVSLRWAAIALAGLALGGVVIFSICWRVLGTNRAEVRDVDRPNSVARPAPTTDVPLLQPTQKHDQLPRQDLETLRASEDRVFTGLGWKRGADPHAWRVPDEVIRRVAASRPVSSINGGTP
jgi:hypothetical protein